MNHRTVTTHLQARVLLGLTFTILVGLAVGVTPAAGQAINVTPLIFSEDFNSYSSPHTGGQCETGLQVRHSGTVPSWTGGGIHHTHTVNLDGAGDFALHLYSGGGSAAPNTLTLDTGIKANDAGVVYRVSFDAGPSAWASCSQTTAAADGLVIDILKVDGSALTSHTHQPGAWPGGAGSQAMSPGEFTYVGDGSGDVRIRLRTLRPMSGRFGGAIDNLRIHTADSGSATPCGVNSKCAFITDDVWAALYLGGLAGADQKCQAAAAAAGLPGTYKAWISSSTVSAASRLNPANVPYKRTDGATIADNWADLTDGTIAVPINLSETQVVPNTGRNPWTNTRPEGTITDTRASRVCNDWTADSGFQVNIGSPAKSDAAWSQFATVVCTATGHLYCFQQ